MSIEVPSDDDWRGYEVFTSQLVETLASHNQVRTRTLRQDASIEGEATSHQIDVWWEFEWEGVRRRLAFQCKHQKRPVKKGDALTFVGVLKDLSRRETSGIMVSRVGFTKGALEVLRHYEVGALELRRPSEKDWTGRVQDIRVQFSFQFPRLKEVEFGLVNEADSGVLDDYPLYFIRDFPELATIHRAGTPTSRSLLSELLDHAGERMNHPPVRGEVRFGSATYLQPDLDAPLIEIDRIAYDIDLAQPRDEIVIRGTDVIRFVLRDAVSCSWLTFDPKGNPREQFSFPFKRVDPQQQ